MANTYSIDDRQLITALMDGAVGVLPTDTVYGLACRAADQAAVSKLYGLKDRESKPGTVIAADVSQLEQLGLDYVTLSQAEEHWPGPVSVEIKNSLDYLTQSTGRNAYRVVSGPPQLLDLLRITGPLLTSSANAPGSPVSGTIAEARRYFDESVSFYVDGGDLSGNLPSTLVRITASGTEVLRSGAGTISAEQETT